MTQIQANNSEYIENRTFDEIEIGDSATLVRTLRHEDIQMYAIMSGDINPSHVDPEYANSSLLREVIAHGMWGGALISNVLGTQFPGPGTVYIDQSLHFALPVRVGDTLTVTITCQKKYPRNKHMVMDCTCTNQDGQKVITGSAEVQAPVEKIKRLKAKLPDFKLSETRKARFEHLLEITRGLTPVSMAVAHPCDTESLKGALQARDRGLIVPTLVGPEEKIRQIAEANQFDLYGCTLINVAHSHAAAEIAVSLAREGQVEALMKGSPAHRRTDGEVIDKVTGLRTARRISHVFLMDVPTYPRLLFITDAAVNVAPDLEDKVDIVQNAIDLARMLGSPSPRSRSSPRWKPSTQDAGDARRRGAVQDGRPRPDHRRPARRPAGLRQRHLAGRRAAKGIKSAVAGQADILLVPDIESGNMLAKQLEYLADALTAGIVLGARVPIVLTSRADSAETRTASTAVAVVMAHAKRKKA
jgi:phosphate acetyltransferase